MMEKIIDRILVSQVLKENWCFAQISIFFYKDFIRCFLSVDEKIVDYEFSKEEMVCFYNFLKEDKEKQPDHVNRLNIKLEKQGRYLLEYIFDLEFAEEHERF